MDNSEREAFKEQLGAMAAGRGDGIDLDSPNRWVINDLKDPVAFFRHVDKLIPVGSNFYFEGCDVLPEWQKVFEKHRATNAVCVARDTIFPVPEIFHVPMSPQVTALLVETLADKPASNAFNHVKAYREGKLLFAFHDAFDGSPFLVSDLVAEENVKAFCTALGISYRSERNANNRDPEQLRRLLWLMENPEKLRFSRQSWPWWKKLLFFWKK